MNASCKLFLGLIFTAIAFTMSSVWAHGSHDHDHKPQLIQIDEIPLDGLDERQYRQMLDDAHHAIESEGLETTEPEGKVRKRLRRWRNNFQFKRNILNAYRWYSSHRDVPYAENAAANIAGMLLTSHTIETVGGWTMAAAGVANGLDSPVEWAMTTVGVGISMPGLDPLCIVLLGIYKRWPRQMNRMLTAPRLFVVRATKTALGVAGVPEWYLPAVREKYMKENFIEEFKSSGGALSVYSVMGQDLEFHIYGTRADQAIVLSMYRRPDGRQALRAVSFSNGAPAMVRTYMSSLLKPFGVNIRELVLEMDKFIGAGKFEAMAKLPYVEKIDQSSVRRTIFLKDNAFPFFRLEESELSCEARLTAL